MTQSEVVHPDAIHPVAEAWDLTREFRVGRRKVQVLRGVSLQVAPGELVALRGRSGSGKTTLLNLLTGLDRPTRGRVLVLGHDLGAMSEFARCRLRREHVGVMFQNAHLFPLLTAQENVEMTLRLAGLQRHERRDRARAALERVGLGGRTHHRGLELSGGEQQRVALARALAHRPRFIVADEPTGSLDTGTGREIIALLRETVTSEGIGFLVATHDQTVVAAADRVLNIADGVLMDG